MDGAGLGILADAIAVVAFSISVLFTFVRLFSKDTPKPRGTTSSTSQPSSVAVDDLVLRVLQTNGAHDLDIVTCVPGKALLIRAEPSSLGNDFRFFTGLTSIMVIAAALAFAMLVMTEKTLGDVALIWIFLAFGLATILIIHLMRNCYLLFVVSRWLWLKKPGVVGVFELLPSRVTAPCFNPLGSQIDESKWRAELWLDLDYRLAAGPVYETLDEAQNHYIELAGVLARMGKGSVQRAKRELFKFEIHLKRLWRRLTGRNA